MVSCHISNVIQSLMTGKTPHQWSSKCGPQASSIGVTWELGRNAHFQVPHFEADTLEVASNLCFHTPSTWFWGATWGYMAWPTAGPLVSLSSACPGSAHSCFTGLPAPGPGQMKSSEPWHLWFFSRHAFPPAMWVAHSSLWAGLCSSVILEGVPGPTFSKITHLLFLTFLHSPCCHLPWYILCLYYHSPSLKHKLYEVGDFFCPYPGYPQHLEHSLAPSSVP